MKVLIVTGAAGFLGRHVIEALRCLPDIHVVPIVRGADWRGVFGKHAKIDGVIHLAGVNRPDRDEEFTIGNHGVTAQMCGALHDVGFRGNVVFASSVQAACDNAYGRSKRMAEECLADWAVQHGGQAMVFRLKNVFGKWSRPNYNSVVATFCHNISRDLPIQINDPGREMELVYVDDVVSHLIAAALAGTDGQDRIRYLDVQPVYKRRLSEIAELLSSFRAMRTSLLLPRLDDDFARRLYATYLSHLEASDFAYNLPQWIDPRGALAEFVKGSAFGQIFVSRTKPGITRGNHYHNTKTEKFLVVEGEACIRFRRCNDSGVLEYRVKGADMRVIDIPPGFTHSIENVGGGELVTLFWASEVFNPERPDTIASDVIISPL